MLDNAKLTPAQVAKLVAERHSAITDATAISANFAKSSLQAHSQKEVQGAPEDSLLPSTIAKDTDDTALGSACDLADRTPETSGEKWPKARPFIEPPSAYPIELFPPILRNAVLEVEKASKAPRAMIASSLLATLSAASQGHYNVVRDKNNTGPISLYFLTLAASGERKSAVDKYFGKPLIDYQRSEKAKGEPLLTKYKAEKSAWEAARQGIEVQIKKAYSGGKTTDSPESLTSKLIDLQAQEPKAPLIPNLLITDITVESLHKHLGSEYPVAFLTTAEGGSVLGGRSFSKENQLATLATFDKLWSGETIRTKRKVAEFFTVEKARLSLSIALQPKVFEKFLGDNGNSREIGFLARCLFSFPESTMGNRFYEEPCEQMPSLNEFHEAVKRLLTIPLQLNGCEVETKDLSFSVEAKIIWTEFFNSIEKDLEPVKGRLKFLGDFGSKTAENAARLAAVFQSVCLLPKEIDAACMKAGCAVAKYHLDQALFYFTTESQRIPKGIANAQKLEIFIGEYALKNNRGSTRTHLLQNGPVRDKASLDEALKILAEKGRARVRSDRTVILNPDVLEEVRCRSI